MNGLVVLLLLFHAANAVKHSLMIFYTGSSGLQNFPDFEAVGEIDTIQAGYCNSSTITASQDWAKQMFDSNLFLLNIFEVYCFNALPAFFKYIIKETKQLSHQTEGVSVLQRIDGCEWDEETKEFAGFIKYGFNGEDLIKFELKTKTWISLIEAADSIQDNWNNDVIDIVLYYETLTIHYPLWLNKSLDFGKSSLLKTDYPQTSLLQKTPSSPVRCHATGFYPNRAVLFWRKDGEEIHESVTHEEILPNHDDTFQLHVDLDVSSLTLKDWSRYDCVFQFTGTEDKTVIKLDKDVIQTNFGNKSRTRNIIIAVISVLIVIIIAALGFAAYKKKKERPSTPTPDTISL